MPKTFPNRAAIVTMMLVGAFIFWVWEAGLISFVSVRKTNLPVKTLQDVLERSSLTVNNNAKGYKRLSYTFLSEIMLVK